MQAYEHIMATMLMFANSKNYELEKNLKVMRKYGAYFTYPDSVRASVGKTLGTAYRSISHFTDGAGMKYVIGDELKNAEAYPISKMKIPFGIQSKAAEGETNLSEAIKANSEVFATYEGGAILNHLVQDTLSDRFFQTDIAECYYQVGGKELETSQSLNLYGVEAKEGLCRFKNSGEITTMSDFRVVVSKLQTLTTYELYKRLKATYPEITFDKIQEVISASYDDAYPESMKNAKKYVVPSKEIQEKMDYALRTGDESYFEEIKEELATRRIYNSKEEISKKVSNFIDSTTSSKISTKFEEKDDYLHE